MSKEVVQACDCACYLVKHLRRAEGCTPDAQRIHNLLYLVYRECACMFDGPQFACNFLCGDRGVICDHCSMAAIRAVSWFPASDRLSKNACLVLNSILHTYGGMSTEQLSRLVCSEQSWKAARALSNDSHRESLSIELIALDARKVDRMRALWNLSYSTTGASDYEDHDMEACYSFAFC